MAEAKYPFFFETLVGPPPTFAPERRKYELAQAVCEYINWLADRPVSLEELYVTNLCNEFLPHKHNSGTVLIPDDKAEHGLTEIEQAIARGHLRVILPICRMRRRTGWPSFHGAGFSRELPRSARLWRWATGHCARLCQRSQSCGGTAKARLAFGCILSVTFRSSQ